MAAGAALAEWIVNGEARSVDISRFGAARFAGGLEGEASDR